MSIWVHVPLCVHAEHRGRPHVFSFVTLILTALKWTKTRTKTSNVQTVNSKNLPVKGQNAGVTDLCSHALLSMLCRRFEIMSSWLHKYSYSQNYLPRTGVTNFTLKFYENEISFTNTKSFEKHEYCVWEAIGHSGASTTIIVLNGHVLTLLYKYLCPHTLVLHIYERRFLLQHDVVNLETLKWLKVARISVGGVMVINVDSLYLLLEGSGNIMRKEVKKM